MEVYRGGKRGLLESMGVILVFEMRWRNMQR